MVPLPLLVVNTESNVTWFPVPKFWLIVYAVIFDAVPPILKLGAVPVNPVPAPVNEDADTTPLAVKLLVM